MCRFGFGWFPTFGEPPNRTGLWVQAGKCWGGVVVVLVVVVVCGVDSGQRPS